MANCEIKDPTEFTDEIPKWDRETSADGDEMGKVIEKLLNNDAYLKKILDDLGLTGEGSGSAGGVFMSGSSIGIENKETKKKIEINTDGNIIFTDSSGDTPKTVTVSVGDISTAITRAKEVYEWKTKYDTLIKKIAGEA